MGYIKLLAQTLNYFFKAKEKKEREREDKNGHHH